MLAFTCGRGRMSRERQDRPNVVGDYGRHRGNTVKYLFGKIARQDELKARGKWMNICGAPACDSVFLVGLFISNPVRVGLMISI